VRGGQRQRSKKRPVELGIVQSLTQPGGNITGFTNFETSVGGKMLQLLKENRSSDRARRRDLQSAERRRQIVFAYLESAASALAVETMTMLVESDADIEAAMTRPQRRWPSEHWARWQLTKMLH
jgi:putative tryptophan/tyrosine transport system substrate-binding protein